MTTTLLSQLGIIPALLITLTGILILRGADREKAKRRFLLFLLGVGVLLQLTLFIMKRFITEPYNQPFFQANWLLAPSVIGVLVLVLFSGKTALAGMSRGSRELAAILGLAMVILFIVNRDSQLNMEYLVLLGTLILAIGWALGRRSGWLPLTVGLVSLVGLFLNNWLMSHPPDFTGGSPFPVFGIVYALGINIWPFLAVVLSAGLMTTNLKRMSEQGDNAAHRRSRLAHLFQFGLAFLLLFYLAYTVFWGSVWDQTDDGLFGIMISSLAGLIAIGAGMVMMVTLKGKFRLAGLFFAILVPIMLYQAFNAGWRVSYHEITERRAESIARALDRFYAREGYYPESLEVLTPRDLLLVQQPVILAGEQWCYEGSTDYYRLSAFYREFFSAPVSLRVYASAGEPPSIAACEERLAEMKKKYYSPMEDPSAMKPPSPTAVPKIDVGMPQIEVQPIENGVVAVAGSWSPDSTYFAFGAPGNFTLEFLNSKTGDVYISETRFSSIDSLRGHYAWLSDGRLLYVDASGEMGILTPCQPGTEVLLQSPPDMVSEISLYSTEQHFLLFKSKSTYWILDTSAFSWLPIPDVTPNPYEFHWDTYAWLPDSDYLVIGRLNGRKGSNAGATLFLINAQTGHVENQLAMSGEFNQSAPWIEGLSNHELLVHANGKLLIVDFKEARPKATDVLKDIFGLDIKYPDDVSAAGAHKVASEAGYYLAVRVNHPRNQSTYLYDSQTRKVHVFDYAYHTLLLFPDGYMMEMPKQELAPTYQDLYNVIMVNLPEAVQTQLRITGHTPREDPHLNLTYLAKTSQIAVASVHGVSLISLADGTMQSYWALPGGGYSPWITSSPDGSSLVAVKDYGGLYYIPLPAGQ